MSNIKIKIKGETYEVREKALNYYTNGNIYIGPVEAGQLVKQFVKKNFPQYVVKVKSASFSGGNSLDVYVSTKIGGSIPPHVFHQVNEFANLWEYGKFNGMIDLYEYTNDGITSDNGTPLKAGVKYVHVNNRPQFDTVEYVLNEVLNEGRTPEDATKYISTTVRAKAMMMLDKLTK